MRVKKPRANKRTKVQDILDWANDMGQTHSAKNSKKQRQMLNSSSRRKEEKRLFYLGVKRKRTKSPLGELNPGCCMKKQERKDDQEMLQPVLRNNTHSNSSCMTAFFKLFEDDLIQDFLWTDSCAKISDKYLLAMVYAYFKRADLTKREFNRNNFFVALHLANDMEEDDEDQKYDILPWALGHKWRDMYPGFLAKRDKLWGKMDYRAVVSRKTCEEVMAIVPHHPIWQRTRKHHHGGAIRELSVYDDDECLSPRGPGASPIYCRDCENDMSSGSSGYFSSTIHRFYHKNGVHKNKNVICIEVEE